MTDKKIAAVLLSMLLIFVGFLAGLFVGRTTADNMYRYFPAESVESTTLPETTDQTEPVPHSYPSEPEVSIDEMRWDLNKVTKEELMEIPGIGEVLAQRILDFRQLHGPFQSVEDLEKVNGIGEKRLEDLRNYLFVEDKR